MFSCKGYTDLQPCGLLLAELFQLLERLQEQHSFGEDQQALICSPREVKLSFAALHLLQRSTYGCHVG